MSEQHILDAKTLVKLLQRNGWLQGVRLGKITEEILRGAIAIYQAFHGLDPDGWAGPQTVRHLELPRFCACPDCSMDAADAPRWPVKRITYCATNDCPRLTREQMLAAIDQGWQQWAAVCDITPARVATPAEALVLIEFAAIDGARQVLAWSELADGTTAVKHQRYDSSETWVVSASPAQAQIDLVAVSCHEIGHVLGIPHLSSGNLMAPIYDPRIRAPQAGDIAEARRRYGAPVAGPTPPGPDLPPPVPGPAPGAEQFVTFPSPVRRIKISVAA